MSASRKGCALSLATLACLAMVGCGDDGEGPGADAAVDVASPDVASPDVVPPSDSRTDPDAFVDSGTNPDTASPYCTSKPPAFDVTDVSGTWVVRTVGAQVLNAPVVGEMHPRIIFLLLIDIAQSGGELRVKGRYCKRSQVDSPGSLIHVVIPDKWAHKETPIDRPGVFVKASDGTPTLSFSAFSEVVGAQLASASDPLPTTATDPRIIDEDEDGFPGITIALSGVLSGSLYSVQAQTTAMTAALVSADRAEGTLSFTSAQNVVASNPETLQVLYGAAKPTQDPTPCASSAAMVRLPSAAVDGGAAGVTCEWVRANEAVLFPQ